MLNETPIETQGFLPSFKDYKTGCEFVQVQSWRRSATGLAKCFFIHENDIVFKFSAISNG
jgi:hypothetical protein